MRQMPGYFLTPAEDGSIRERKRAHGLPVSCKGKAYHECAGKPAKRGGTADGLQLFVPGGMMIPPGLFVVTGG